MARKGHPRPAMPILDIDDDEIERPTVSVSALLETVDIVAVIAEDEKLKPSGTRYFRGVEHPSLVVDTKKQVFFWNSMNISGNVITWLMKVRNVSYSRALEILSPRIGKNITDRPVRVPVVSKQVDLGIEAVQYWNALLKETKRNDYFNGRGINDETIDEMLLGWDGKRYVIPTWEYEPKRSRVINVALRASDLCQPGEPKYISLKGVSAPFIAGLFQCRGKRTIFGFAGLTDYLLANQDGLPSFSVVPGQNATQWLAGIPDWPKKYFPDAVYLVLPWDKLETATAAVISSQWKAVKGAFHNNRPTVEHIFWPIFDDEVGDYCSFRRKNDADGFRQFFRQQIRARKSSSRNSTMGTNV